MKRFLRVIAVILAIHPSAASISLSAQNNQTGTIRGAVIDVSNAAMPGVTITVTSPALLVAQTTVTDGTGTYHFEQLPVGIYKAVSTCPDSGNTCARISRSPPASRPK